MEGPPRARSSRLQSPDRRFHKAGQKSTPIGSIGVEKKIRITSRRRPTGHRQRGRWLPSLVSGLALELRFGHFEAEARGQAHAVQAAGHGVTAAAELAAGVPPAPLATNRSRTNSSPDTHIPRRFITQAFEHPLESLHACPALPATFVLPPGAGLGRQSSTSILRYPLDAGPAPVDCGTAGHRRGVRIDSCPWAAGHCA